MSVNCQPRSVNQYNFSSCASLFRFFSLTFNLATNLSSMTKKRLIFYGVFALFHIASFIFTLTLPNKENFMDMVKYIEWISLFKYVTLIGLLLLVVDVVWAFKADSDAHKEEIAAKQELTHLKAKLFDIQEGKK